MSVLDFSGGAVGSSADLIAARTGVFLETGTYGGEYVAAFVNASSYAGIWSWHESSWARFDHHWIHWPKPESSSRLGAVYTTEDEMRYGPRTVDTSGLAHIREVVATREALPAPPVSLE